MTNFDEKVKETLSEENIQIPETVHSRIEETLNTLPKNEGKINKKNFSIVRKIVGIAASFAFALLVFMPNVSVTYAQVMSNVPVLGAIIEVFTVRNYNFDGEKHELHAEVPNLESNDDFDVSDLNANIDTFTTSIINKFYDDLASENVSYTAIDMDYEVVTNNDTWFTLKINVTETGASGYMYAKYYHINPKTGELITFGDLFDSTSYLKLEEYIISDMKAQMESDENIIYFFDDPVLGEDIIYVNDNQNFYFNENNNLVMAYNEYEVAPGYMGCPEIIIPYEIFNKLMK